MKYLDVYKTVYNINEFKEILNPFEFCKDYNIDIVLKDFSENEYLQSISKDGFVKIINNKYTIYLNSASYIKRLNFTLWHEIGHIFLGHFKTKKDIPYEDKEKEANIFARNMLIPHIFFNTYKNNKYFYENVSLEACRIKEDMNDIDNLYATIILDHDKLDNINTEIV